MNRFSGHKNKLCSSYSLNRYYKLYPISDPVTDLGIPKVSFSSLKYWLTTFGLVNSDYSPNFLYDKLMEKDPEFLNCDTYALIHHNMIVNSRSILYYEMFSEFIPTKIDHFTTNHLLRFIINKYGNDSNYNTIANDINMALKLYIDNSSPFDDKFTMSQLRLLIIDYIDEDKINYFKMNPYVNLSLNIMLYAIICLWGGKSIISLKEYFKSPYSPHIIYGLNIDKSMSLLTELSNKYNGIIIINPHDRTITINTSLTCKDMLIKYLWDN